MNGVSVRRDQIARQSDVHFSDREEPRTAHPFLPMLFHFAAASVFAADVDAFAAVFPVVAGFDFREASIGGSSRRTFSGPGVTPGAISPTASLARWGKPL